MNDGDIRRWPLADQSTISQGGVVLQLPTLVGEHRCGQPPQGFRSGELRE